MVGHLVQNSLDATEVPGRVWVKLQKQGGSARIEVGDNGAGMTQEFIRERLFKPFQTTKQAGMGIGAYESSQYVQELGGKILVDKGGRGNDGDASPAPFRCQFAFRFAAGGGMKRLAAQSAQTRRAVCHECKHENGVKRNDRGTR